MDLDLHDYAACLFDLDGTLWTGSGLYDGACDLMRALTAAETRCVIVSNNSVLTGERARAALARHGLGGDPLAVTVTDVAGEYIRKVVGNGTARVRVAGVAALTEACRAAGLRTMGLREPGRADVLLLGLHDSFTYGSLERLAVCVEQGERLVVTNEDPWHPGPNGTKVPETGALLAALLTVYPCDYLTVGKPGPLLFDRALALAGVGASEAVMIGDSLSTDVAGARSVGIDAIWISFGRPLPELADGEPTAVCESLSELALAFGTRDRASVQL